MANQVNVFAQNQPGRLERLTEVLLEEGINIRAITISGADDYGVIKLLVDDPRKAFDALQREGFSAFLKEVIAVVMDDRPGGLHRVCRVLGEGGVNVEDAYGFVFQDRKTAILVVEVEKVSEAEEILKAKGLEFLSDEELYSL
ncbi:MAG: ACT domain-containing protein [Actinomycetota bacterium]|nr:ACT domain-containing protein [Actinomycetota bacterium]MDD5666995.1 ACT domain-containing protein [Actinomycetota bacterium]